MHYTIASYIECLSLTIINNNRLGIGMKGKPTKVSFVALAIYNDLPGERFALLSVLSGAVMTRPVAA